MTTNVISSKNAPQRAGLTHEEIWDGPDQGLIMSWEVGRARAMTYPELAQQCLSGQLPILGWKGGVSRALKKREKFGSLKYLAQWQGLRGEDINIDCSKEHTLTCINTGMAVTFTSDKAKYVNQSTENDSD